MTHRRKNKAGQTRPRINYKIQRQRFRKAFGEYAHALFFNLRPVFFFQLLYCIGGFLLFFEVFSLLIRFCLKLHSYSYITLQNLPNFLLSPVTLACLLLLFMLALVLVFFDACILLTGVQASLGGFSVHAQPLIFSGFLRGVYAFRARLLKTAIPLIALFISMNIYFVLQLMYRINPYSTYIPIVFRKTIPKAILAAFFIITAVYAFRHLFDFYFVFFERCSVKEARKKSKKMTARHPFQILFSLTIVTLFLILFWNVLRRIAYGLTVFVISFTVAPDLRNALALTLNFYIIMLSLAATIFLGTILYNTLIAFLFYHYSRTSAKEDYIAYRRIIPQTSRHIWMPLATLFVTTVFAITSLFGIYSGVSRAERATPFIQIAAHRGVSSEAPENTLPALELAIEYLSDYVEIDVQCTKDGELVVFHDTSLKRVTGHSRALADMTLAELRELDAGYYFGEPYLNTLIPTFAEVLELSKGRVLLIVELKRNKAGDDLVNKALDMIAEYEMENQCIIQSSDYQYLSQVYDRDPDIITGYILSNAIGNYYTNEKIDFFSVRSAFITNSSVRNIHKAGKKVYAWTVNTREEMERMKRIQVDGIITDYPILAREIIYRGNE